MIIILWRIVIILYIDKDVSWHTSVKFRYAKRILQWIGQTYVRTNADVFIAVHEDEMKYAQPQYADRDNNIEHVHLVQSRVGIVGFFGFYSLGFPFLLFE